MSLLHHLLGEGVDEPILFVDRCGGYGDDRVWCLWVMEKPTVLRALLIGLLCYLPEVFAD